MADNDADVVSDDTVNWYTEASSRWEAMQRATGLPIERMAFIILINRLDAVNGAIRSLVDAHNQHAVRADKIMKHMEKENDDEEWKKGDGANG